MATTGQALGIALGLDAAIALIIILLFGFFRFIESPVKPKKLKLGFFSWVWPTLQYSEQDIVRLNGTDAALYIRVQRFGMELFAFCTLWCCVILLPIHITRGHYVDQQIQAGSTAYTNLDKLAVSNLDEKSKALWADWISVWAVSLFVYWQLWRYNKEAVKLRIAHLNSARAGTESLTIMVDDIPCLHKGLAGKAVVMIGKQASRLPGMKSLSVQSAPKGQQQRQSDEFKDAEQQLARPSGSSDASGKYYDAPEAPQSVIGGSTAQQSAARGVTVEPASGKTQATAKGTHTSPAGSTHPYEYNPDLLRSQNVLLEGGHQDHDEPGASHPRLTNFEAYPKAEAMLASGLTGEQMVRREFQEVFPGKVKDVSLAVDSGKLDKLYKEYTKKTRKLEDTLDLYQMKMERGKKIKKRKTMRVSGLQFGKWGQDKYGKKPVKVDSIEFLADRLQELEKEIKEQQEAARKKPIPTAFVTFNDHRTQTVASTSMMHHDQRYWTTSAAPTPKEIVWSNLGEASGVRGLRTLAAWAIFFVMCAFYFIPVSAVQALIQVQKLQRYHFFRVITDIKILNSIITSILPGLALTIFLAVLPMLLTLLNRHIQKMISETQIDFGVVRKYFAFQVITTFIGTLLVGTFLTQINAFLDDPTGVVTTLGSAAPQVASFFMSYILVQAFIKQPLGLLRLPGLVIFWLRYRLATTERQKARVWEQSYMKYGTNVANDTIIILLGVYFLMGSLFWKYNFAYVYVPNVESGGRLWMDMFDHIMVGLFFFQIIMTALFGVKKAPAETILTVPLIVLSAGFVVVCRRLFSKPQGIMSLRTAADVDQVEQGEQTELEQPLMDAAHQEGPQGDKYIPASFFLDESELRRLLREKDEVSGAVDDYVASGAKAQAQRKADKSSGKSRKDHTELREADVESQHQSASLT
eukprot:jgi/Astpho2/9705/Aster-03695